MRISFPGKEQDDTLVGPGETRIGAAADNNIVVGGSGVAPHHLRLRLGERGIELVVLDAQARTHVNTRPVREKAILRLGDMISLGSVAIVLKPDRDADIRNEIPPPSAPAAATGLPPRVLLRGLSGVRFGKIVPVRGRLVVGKDAQADLDLDESGLAARHAAVEFADETIVLRDLGAGGTTYVNGVGVRDAILCAGDQICFGRDRFLVEAPGLPQRAVYGTPPAWVASTDPTITQTMRAIPLPDEAAVANSATAQDDNGGKNDIWWLIAAAAVIAAGLALLFLGVI
ncbi:FHA domain-containing protein [Rudaea sp.]|uniref:FHA domain-containing protein n=1 Tax=Rudaea sp. TaxID=2136325 RepID=UPI002ED1C6E1